MDVLGRWPEGPSEEPRRQCHREEETVLANSLACSRGSQEVSMAEAEGAVRGAEG